MASDAISSSSDDALISAILSTTGAALAIGLASFGAASGTARSARWWSSLGERPKEGCLLRDTSDHDDSTSYSMSTLPKPETDNGIELQPVASNKNTLKYLVPTIMSGVIAIYGLIMAVIITSSARTGAGAAAQLAAGLASGLACLASGRAIGRTLPADGVAPSATYILPLIFAEAIGLYGLIVGLILNSVPVPDVVN